MIAFGPIPSRRLDFSLGINNIPMKHCSYSCTYCQVGRTRPLEIHRQAFYHLQEIVAAVKQKVEESQRIGQTIDYLSFVPDGEPTLDINLEAEIDALHQFGIPIAVICNATQINDPAVIQALNKADWVSLKVDSVIEPIWRKINRPHKKLNLKAILSGIHTFSQQYTGIFVTETMLVKGVNDTEGSIRPLADYLGELKPAIAYLSIPIRPPAESEVQTPDHDTLQRAYHIVAEKVPTVESLFDEEENQFVSTGNLKEDLLSITAVHPMREPALRKMVQNSNGDWQTVEELIKTRQIKRILYRDETFYLRK
ncbi:MAG: radical SAM protein [Anaerolineaceae bacterium]|nr:radical SAM protein [Anaerolineaceae bacterium]